MSQSPSWLTGPDRFNAFMIGAHALTQLLSHVLIWVTVEGLDRSLPRRGPLIVAPNPASALDPVLVTGYLAPAIRRPIHWMGKQELAADPILGWVLRAYGGFAVRRGGADTDALRAGKGGA